MDANEYALKLKPAHQALSLVLRQARWIGRPATDSAAEEETPEPAPEPAVADAAAEPEPTPSSLAADDGAPARDAAAASVEPVDPGEAPGTLPAETLADEVTVRLGACTWRVRGWRKNVSPEQLRVNVQVRRVEGGEGAGAYHVDTLDLYASKARAAFLRQASAELTLPEEELKRDLGHLLLKLELLQDGLLREAKAPTAVPAMSAQAEREALALLRAPNLGERIVADLQACGVVGEATNLLAGYLAATSRKLEAPLAVLIQSSSAAGKSSLMDAVLTMMPPEERIQYSAMTGQSLFYLGETQLQHKILAIAEEEGVRQAAYALKLLQSDGELTIASTGKDEATGNLVTKQYKVQGPVMLMLTTTAIDVDEELLNRCLVLTVNESREQTRAIHERQRQKQTLAGLLASTEREALVELHRNAQRLLRAVHVVNPYADQLSFGDHQTRTRRDHAKYLGLIQAIALLHQHQREVRTVAHHGQVLAYIEVTREDIALANSVAHEVFGRTLDELPPQTRKLLTLLREWVRAQSQARGVAAPDVRFTRRELRDALAWGDTQLKVHLARLVEMEFVAVHRRGLTHAYELLYESDDEGQRARLCGLREAGALAEAPPQPHAYDSDRSGPTLSRSASGRGQVGARSAPGRTPPEATQSQQRRGLQRDGEAVNGHEHAEVHVQSAALVVSMPVVLAPAA
jgi:post-segregation antitoxin (ccd killing protein)